jgi:hypothetical protein
MLEECSRPGLSRRGLFLLAGASFASWSRLSGFAGKEFWDTKDPAEWNSDDIAKILSKSPWAKATTAESVKSQKNPNSMPGGAASDPNAGMPRSSRNNGGMGRMPGSGSNRQPSSKTVTTYKGTVVWESAAPVRDALKSKLPDGFDGQYVLGVTGVPLTKSDSKNALDRVRQATTLQAKGKPPLEAQGVQEDTTNGTIYLFGFSREALAITKDDKDLVFTTHMGKLAFTAKFNPKDMLYHGELAL